MSLIVNDPYHTPEEIKHLNNILSNLELTATRDQVIEFCNREFDNYYNSKGIFSLNVTNKNGTGYEYIICVQENDVKVTTYRYYEYERIGRADLKSYSFLDFIDNF